MKDSIKKVSIIGVGLIGGSLGLSLKQKHPAWEIVGVGRHLSKLKKAKKKGAIDTYTTDFKKGVKNADLVVLAVPVGKIHLLIEELVPFFKENAIITDVGSVKGFIIKKVEDIFSKAGKHALFFIGAHPMAGSDRSGVDNASVDLFRGATCILTPTKNTNKKALNILKNMWLSLGSRILFMHPEEHDFVVGLTSHIPHILAACLVNTVGKAEKKDKRIKNIVAGSFKDMTRIASSDEQIWTDICVANRSLIMRGLEELQRELKGMAYVVDKGQEKVIFKKFSEAKKIRKKLIENKNG